MHTHARTHARTRVCTAPTTGSMSRPFSRSRTSMRMSLPAQSSCMAAAAVRGDNMAVVEASAIRTRESRRRATSSRVALQSKASRLGIFWGMGCA
eukprot:scaffold191320_cov19-Tisochrysis_lutea.AAC.1